MIGLALELRDRAAVDLPPQELLLSRPAEGLPDLPVRHPARPASGPARRRPRSTACTSRRTPRSSCTPASSGRIHGAEASVVDFNRGGTPLVEIVTEPDLRTASEAAEWLRLLRATLQAARRVRREHGGGLAALRRQHLDPPGRRGHARHQDRAEEHELVPLPRARDRGRDRAPGGAAARGRARWSQETLHFDPADRRAQLAALEGGGARLPLLPRARPRARSRPPRRCSSARARRCRSCPPRAPSASSASSGLPADTGEAARLPHRSSATTSRRRWPPTAMRPSPRARQLGDRRARRAPRRRRAAGLEGRAGARSRELVAMVAAKAVSPVGGQAGARRARGRGRRPAGDRGGAGPRHGRRRTSWARSCERAIDAERRRRRADQGRQREGDRRDRGRRHARDEGPRRRRARSSA